MTGKEKAAADRRKRSAAGGGSMDYDWRFVRFLHLFNTERDYFECHEVMEDLWMDDGRDPFWQGLLQVAVALFHARNGNAGGAVKLMTAGLDKLSRRTGRAAGIDVPRLITDGTRWLERLQSGGAPPPFEPIAIRVTDPELAQAVLTAGTRETP